MSQINMTSERLLQSRAARNFDLADKSAQSLARHIGVLRHTLTQI
jgi:DNA-binding XRE family transcriptional regulator